MIVTCSSCSTRYAVDPESLGHNGRQVKCVRCGHQWFQEPAERSGAALSAAAATEPLGAPKLRRLPPERDSTAVAPAEAAPRRRGVAIGWSLLLVLVGILLAFGYLGRAEIVRAWPPAVKLYEKLGLDVAGDALAGHRVVAGLSLDNVSTERTDGIGGTVVWVRGDVVNRSETQRRVPPLQIELMDGDGNRVSTWTFTVEPAMLEPGATARFETSQRNVPDSATRLVIRAAP